MNIKDNMICNTVKDTFKNYVYTMEINISVPVNLRTLIPVY